MGTIEPVDESEDESGGTPATPPEKKKRPLDGIARGLTEQDLQSPGTQRMLLGELDRLYDEVQVVPQMRSALQRLSVECGVLRERLRSHREHLRSQSVFDVLSGLMFAVGGALLGYVPGMPENSPTRAIASVAVLLLLAPTVTTIVKIWRRSTSSEAEGESK